MNFEHNELAVILVKENHELTVMPHVNGCKWACNRYGVACLTNKRQSTIDNWIRNGWLKPCMKHGTYSLFLLDDVQNILNRKLPRGRSK